ncbi:NADH dehydrogenase [ubiquinone] 1 alpha subcomplex subunit 4-like 2 [Pollicipes pollicipes]|uniref:NADH dehydrogenase [ubiquinone] 1 alpha subcomplex subunit 4-like 2 n=1 Tax=Pollicipes pollicipes TaxID=41117 RepID=UPI0018852EF7|nr:NADH dehydrogenase [ubiquinone] 1 alpha subcomplex subunit 4-like 2 [Pollicipes pollicipes]
MQGLSATSLKRHPALVPLFGALGFGVALATFYTIRLATRNPDVSWRRTSNPEPWEEYRNYQYKFMNTANHDYTKNPAPKF